MRAIILRPKKPQQRPHAALEDAPVEVGGADPRKERIDRGEASSQTRLAVTSEFSVAGSSSRMKTCLLVSEAKVAGASGLCGAGVCRQRRPHVLQAGCENAVGASLQPETFAQLRESADVSRHPGVSARRPQTELMLDFRRQFPRCF